MRTVFILALSFLGFSASAVACDLNDAYEVAGDVLSFDYSKENHIFLGTPKFMSGIKGRTNDIEIQFAIINKNPKLFGVSVMGKVLILQSDECRGRLEVTPTYLLK